MDTHSGHGYTMTKRNSNTFAMTMLDDVDDSVGL